MTHSEGTTLLMTVNQTCR